MKKGHYWVPLYLGKLAQSRLLPNYTQTWSQIQGTVGGAPHGLHTDLIVVK